MSLWRNAALALMMFTIGSTFTSERLIAQAVKSGSAVTAYPGAIQVSSNAKLKQTFIVLTADQNIGEASNQIVFRVQSLTQNLPSSWSGRGRVLFSDTVVAVIPDESNSGWVFKFSSDSIPDSLTALSLTQYDCFGISKFGEKSPLDAPTITEFINTGSIPSIKSQQSASFNVSDAATSQEPFETGKPQHAAPVCSSGGVGSVACSGGGCSVTCQSGYYSCCTSNGCYCTQ